MRAHLLYLAATIPTLHSSAISFEDRSFLTSSGFIASQLLLEIAHRIIVNAACAIPCHLISSHPSLSHLFSAHLKSSLSALLSSSILAARLNSALPSSSHVGLFNLSHIILSQLVSCFLKLFSQLVSDLRSCQLISRLPTFSLLSSHLLSSSKLFSSGKQRPALDQEGSDQ